MKTDKIGRYINEGMDEQLTIITDIKNILLSHALSYEVFCCRGVPYKIDWNLFYIHIGNAINNVFNG